VDQFGQVIDVYLSPRRDAVAARAFFANAVEPTGTEPVEVVTNRALAYVRVIERLLPAACHHLERHANNPVECDHGRLKARLAPMRGLKQQRCTRVIVATPSYKTCAEPTTNSRRRRPPLVASRQPSPSSPRSSEKEEPRHPRGPSTAMQQCHSTSEKGPEPRAGLDCVGAGTCWPVGRLRS
jgi:hypothetical protein